MTEVAQKAIAENIAKYNRGEDARALDLRLCGLTEIPEEVEKLFWLEELNLSNTTDTNKILHLGYTALFPIVNIIAISHDIYKYFKNRNIIHKIHGLTDKLPNLKTLYLDDIGLISFENDKTHESLESLFVGKNNLQNIDFASKYPGIKRLGIKNNNIISLDPVSALISLEFLDFENNQVETLTPLENLKSIKILVTGNNLIKSLKPLKNLIGDNLAIKFDKDLSDSGIFVANNHWQDPPIEIIQQGNEAILEYFRQKEKSGSKPLLEAKMILLGDGRAGKTSLACRLLGQALPKQEDRTLGVDIIIDEYRFAVEEGEFKLHIWDFAGQDKYKPLHQFFYTEDAVYVMVADSGNAQTDFADWFETAEIFGGADSPLLVVLNEFSDNIGMGTFDQDKWRRQFPKIFKEVHLVNLLSQKGFPQLEKDIRHLANQLPHTRIEYPANWANIRTELESRREENYISLQEYLNICSRLELPERDSALILSGILHKIGVCLHYQYNDLLRLHVILNNEWATTAVYKILEDQIVSETKKGFFDWSDLRRIWSEDRYQDMQPQLLALMCEFKMAYPLLSQKEFVTPPLLPTTPPKDWSFPEGEAIELRVEYEFLPKALMTQFIVSRHSDIDRNRTLVWREGVVLRWNNTIAQVSKIKSRGRDAFQIYSMGSDRRGLLTAIMKTLRELHDEYRGIRAHEIVPCPCNGCRTALNTQHYFEFKNLTNRLERGRQKVECDQSLEEIDLMKTLGDLMIFENLGIGEPTVLKDVDQKKVQRTIKIFLASSAELAAEREKIEIEINRLNKDLHQEYIFLELLIWEDGKHIGKSFRSQDNYNLDVKTCDIFILLFYSRVGKFTSEEFQIAKKRFDAGGAPRILIFQKDIDLPKNQSREDANSRLDFLEALREEEHFPILFPNTEGLLKSLVETLRSTLSSMQSVSK